MQVKIIITGTLDLPEEDVKDLRRSGVHDVITAISLQAEDLKFKVEKVKGQEVEE